MVRRSVVILALGRAAVFFRRLGVSSIRWVRRRAVALMACRAVAGRTALVWVAGFIPLRLEVAVLARLCIKLTGWSNSQPKLAAPTSFFQSGVTLASADAAEQPLAAAFLAAMGTRQDVVVCELMLVEVNLNH